MDKHVLVIAATAFVAWGASTAGAQDYPDYATREQPQVVQQRQELERQLERAQSPRRSVESDNDQDDGGEKTRRTVDRPALTAPAATPNTQPPSSLWR